MKPNKLLQRITLLFVIVCVSLLIWPTQLAFTMTNEETRRLVYAARVSAGDKFSIRFLHSVHRTPVEEHFYISNDREMVLERVIYESYGVGNPSEPEPGEQFRLEDGKMIIENMNRRFPEIHQRIGQKVADHRLTLGGRSTPFRKWSPPGSRVLLKVKLVSPWTLWRGGAHGVEPNQHRNEHE
jgi:hypothetical protein